MNKHCTKVVQRWYTDYSDYFPVATETPKAKAAPLGVVRLFVLKGQRMTTDVAGYVTAIQASRLLGVSYWQVAYFCRTRRIPKLKLDGRTTLNRFVDLAPLGKKDTK